MTAVREHEDLGIEARVNKDRRITTSFSEAKHVMALPYHRTAQASRTHLAGFMNFKMNWSV